MHYRETVWTFLKKLGIHLPYDPETPLLGIHPEKTTILKDVYKTWNQPRCPLTDEWMNKMWHIYTMQYYTAMKRMNLRQHIKKQRHYFANKSV